MEWLILRVFMPKQTKYKYKDFLKTDELAAYLKYEKIIVSQKRGSGVRFEVFIKESDKEPHTFWVVHEDKFIYTKDLRKTCNHLQIEEKVFIKMIENN